ncbi:hypothetical protein QFW96_29410 [Saccharopolyspora sp. TS4A08]|uniref:Uncharacterized protein n=1 Tax=Saccharopolyspora ipomoeae TaxID=3042027 RepID=A0ABT6PZE1_9PSEU|nr:hypothetical protein [Saccharopolyspora sp. TS4A08]MDI2032771.1 hypothetical protein [Saccharopolyspora sp. TS4A08]
MGVRIDLARLAGNTDQADRSTEEPTTERRPLPLPRLLRRRPETTGRTPGS